MKLFRHSNKIFKYFDLAGRRLVEEKELFFSDNNLYNHKV